VTYDSSMTVGLLVQSVWNQTWNRKVPRAILY